MICKIISHKITEPYAQIPTNIIKIVLEAKQYASHKITEPYAQIPTQGDQENINGSKVTCHKITEPYAQIPTYEKLEMFIEIPKTPSQNNRALRSNPN